MPDFTKSELLNLLEGAPKVKVIIRRGSHEVFVDDKSIGRTPYDHPTIGNGFMYLSPYWGEPGLYKIEKLCDESAIEYEDISLKE